MPFVGFTFCLLCNKPELVGHCVWGKRHHDKYPSQEIWIRHAFRLTFAPETQIRLFHCQSENNAEDLKRVGWLITKVQQFGRFTLIFPIRK